MLTVEEQIKRAKDLMATPLGKPSGLDPLEKVNIGSQEKPVFTPIYRVKKDNFADDASKQMESQISQPELQGLGQRYGLPFPKTQEEMAQYQKNNTFDPTTKKWYSEQQPNGQQPAQPAEQPEQPRSDTSLAGDKVWAVEDIDKMFGISKAQSDVEDWFGKIKSSLSKVGTGFDKTEIDKKSAEITNLDKEIADTKAKWDKSLVDIENQAIPMPLIVGQRAHQAKIANLELTRLQSQRDALAGDYDRAFKLANYAYDLKQDIVKSEKELAKIGYGIAEKQLTSAQKKKADFIEAYLKRNEPNIQISKSTDNQGNLTITGFDKDTGEIKYTKVIEGVGKATGDGEGDEKDTIATDLSDAIKAINAGADPIAVKRRFLEKHPTKGSVYSQYSGDTF